MPKLPIDYNNTIIYKLVCRNLAIKNCYVGHTTNFTNRKRLHKSGCKTRQYYLYQFIQDNGGWDNWDMIEIEKYPCKDVYEASARERHWIEELNAVLNTYSPITGLTKSEFAKQYRDKTVDTRKTYAKEYYKNNPDKFKSYDTKRNTEKRNELLEYRKQYRIKNVEKIRESQSVRICCILCKSEMRRYGLNRHYKTQHNIST